MPNDKLRVLGAGVELVFLRSNHQQIIIVGGSRVREGVLGTRLWVKKKMFATLIFEKNWCAIILDKQQYKRFNISVGDGDLYN